MARPRGGVTKQVLSLRVHPDIIKAIREEAEIDGMPIQRWVALRLTKLIEKRRDKRGEGVIS